MIITPFVLRDSGEVTYVGRPVMDLTGSRAEAVNIVAALNLAHALGQRDAIAEGISLDEAVREVQVQVRVVQASPGFYG